MSNQHNAKFNILININVRTMVTFGNKSLDIEFDGIMIKLMKEYIWF